MKKKADSNAIATNIGSKTKAVSITSLFSMCFEKKIIRELKEKNKLLYGTQYKISKNHQTIGVIGNLLKECEPKKPWDHLIKKCTHYHQGQTSKIFKSALRKNYHLLTITPDRRLCIWWDISGAHTRMNECPEYYYKLNQHLKNYPKNFLHAIDLDLHRTFPGEDIEDTDEIIKKMRKVLSAYSKRNNYVGYCQGMNFIVAYLLKNCREIEAFWILAQIIEIYMPVDYYTSMLSVLADQQIFKHLLQVKIPKVAKHLENIELDPSLFALQWFMCLYTNTVHQEILKIIWDFIFIEGNTTLFKVGLILIKLVENDILKTSDMGAAIQVIESKIMQISDVSRFKYELSHFYLSCWTINKLREIYRAKIKEELRQNDEEAKKKHKSIILNEPPPKCNKMWPTCLVELKNKSKLKKSSSFFSFQSNFDSANIITNHFSESNIKKKLIYKPNQYISKSVCSLEQAIDNEKVIDILISRDIHSESCAFQIDIPNEFKSPQKKTKNTTLAVIDNKLGSKRSLFYESVMEITKDKSEEMEQHYEFLNHSKIEKQMMERSMKRNAPINLNDEIEIVLDDDQENLVKNLNTESNEKHISEETNNNQEGLKQIDKKIQRVFDEEEAPRPVNKNIIAIEHLNEVIQESFGINKSTFFNSNLKQQFEEKMLESCSYQFHHNMAEKFKYANNLGY